MSTNEPYPGQEPQQQPQYPQQGGYPNQQGGYPNQPGGYQGGPGYPGQGEGVWRIQADIGDQHAKVWERTTNKVLWMTLIMTVLILLVVAGSMFFAFDKVGDMMP